MKRSLFSAFGLVLFAPSALAAEPAAFRFEDGEGYRDLFVGSKPVYRYMHAFDPARRDETYKPFLHVYDFHGGGFITKGAGGKYTHHRGLFIGWNKTGFEGKSYDFWHCKGVERRFDSFVPESAPGRMHSVTRWPDPSGKVAVEEHQVVDTKVTAEGLVQLDFAFALQAPNGPVTLNGDPQHAGFHFRAASEVEQKNSATYVRPSEATTQGKDVWTNCPWVVCQFPIQGNRYEVALMNHPANPRPASFSTRQYGRFGAFFTSDVSQEKPLALRFRVLISESTKTRASAAPDWAKAYETFVTENPAAQ
ncbi:MAG: PmoA family protein [Verrucomicrobiota bacterium]|nr:PmoA family protein [Verrucomicrobiota bacterium]